MAKNKYNKPCPITDSRIDRIDYKNIKLLLQFISRHGKIVPRYYSGVTLQNQKSLATAIKRARQMALIPYTGKPRIKQ
jgi:small subunit ribosomal protein S18